LNCLKLALASVRAPLIPDLDRLVIAAPAHGTTPAAIWIFRPMP
jgi:hypothetical protein